MYIKLAVSTRSIVPHETETPTTIVVVFEPEFCWDEFGGVDTGVEFSMVVDGFDVLIMVPADVFDDMLVDVLADTTVEILVGVPINIPADVFADAFADVPTDVPTDVLASMLADMLVEVLPDVSADVLTDVPADVSAEVLIAGGGGIDGEVVVAVWLLAEEV